MRLKHRLSFIILKEVKIFMEKIEVRYMKLYFRYVDGICMVYMRDIIDGYKVVCVCVCV